MCELLRAHHSNTNFRERNFPHQLRSSFELMFWLASRRLCFYRKGRREVFVCCLRSTLWFVFNFCEFCSAVWTRLRMSRKKCTFCYTRDAKIYHKFPSLQNPVKRKLWLDALKLSEHGLDAGKQSQLSVRYIQFNYRAFEIQRALQKHA